MASLQGLRELWVRPRVVCMAECQLASPCKCHESRWNASLIHSPSWRDELCDYFSTISYQHGLAQPNLADVLTQPVLQVPKAHTLHTHNVAS
jgi:hypothetical protein